MRELPPKKIELIETLVAEVRRHLSDERWQASEPFVRHCFADVALDEMRRIGVEGLTHIVLSMLDRTAQREPGEIRVSLFNPEDEGADWGEHRTVIEVVTDDMPFLVDSLTGELNRRELTIHLAVHPQIAARRDSEGRLLALLPLAAEGDDVLRESVMHLQVDLQPTTAERVELETAVRQVLSDVDTAVRDWQPMREAGQRAIDGLHAKAGSLHSIDDDVVEETLEFLRWVVGDHFTFLGFIEYDLAVEGGNEYLRPDRSSGLGLYRHLSLQEQAASRLPLSDDARRFLHGSRLVLISKTSQKSTVHRQVHMDVISLKRFDADGEVDGEIRFVGLFTSMAYSIASRDIPLVRRKVERVMENTRFLADSYDAKVLRHIVENYPRDELFQISEEDLYRFAMRILELQLRPRLALLVRRDEEERFVSCMVYIPREVHNTEVRQEVQKILEGAFDGVVSAYYTRISERPLAQLHFLLQTRPGRIPEYDVEELEARLAAASQTWSDRLRERLVADMGERLGRDLWQRYTEAFPPAYQQHSDIDDAVADIPHIDQTSDTGLLGIRLYRRVGAASDRFHMRSFERAVAKPLSDFLPILENMGLQVVSENPFRTRPSDAANPVWIRDFEVAGPIGVDLEEVSERFTEAIRRIYQGEVESDGFDRLVLRGGLAWRQAALLRAYCKYLRQTGIAFSQTYMEQTLAQNAEVSRHLVELFHALFDPARQDGVDREQLILGEIHQALEEVASLDEDRILRRFLNLVQSTLRTNFFQPAEGSEGEVTQPKPYMSFKFDGSKVTGLPSPRPAYEIFVYSPRVEAVHLRGGKVARGGIRWSDRREDFRTEILGLVKSQMVKNAVIVPVGAKGGFIVKQPPVDPSREAQLEEGKHCYTTLIRGMLDITDNLDGGRVVPAPDVVRRDGDDPYLVVAADKGTATFSDLANSVAAEYGFWLGDAFASGGSVGYDHKKMGITARGGWESVKRHFREMGRDVQNEPFTCVAVGDMSGDVFGNGMLQSEHTELIGAFNHLHVFVDPNPVATVAFHERQRLFELPRSTWDDYDRSKLSAGGDVFDRQAKSLTVSPEIKARFGLASPTLTPNELIQAILRAQVDLIWFGGIGTYVRAEGESHLDVGDRQNDEIRIYGSELRCAVIGEGANLGLTQRGRIEAALHGVRLNTDFIDNSGGVDCSDHEVNIKIALRDAVRSGRLDGAERDRLLASMTDEVAALVLRDNYLQAQAITLEQAQGIHLLDGQARLMRNLERSEQLDRRLEHLPGDATIAERKVSKKGLTRPEIAVLFAYAKIEVYNELLDSDLPDDPKRRSDLLRYFPAPMAESFREQIESHRLCREIIATQVTNSLINRVGTTFVTRMQDETGRRVSDIARAYIAARDVFEMRSLWAAIEALDNQVPSEHLIRMQHMVTKTIGEITRWFLLHGGQPFALNDCLDSHESQMVVVAAQLEDLLPPTARNRVRRRHRRLRDLGVPDELAVRISSMDILPSACDVALCARATDGEVERVGRIYFEVGERFLFDRLRKAAERLSTEGPYIEAATTVLLDDLAGHQTQLTQQVVGYEGRARMAIKAWSAERPEAVRRLDQLREDFESVGHIDLARLTIAERELRRVAQLR